MDKSNENYGRVYIWGETIDQTETIGVELFWIEWENK